MTTVAALVATTPVLAVDGVPKAFRSGPPWHRRRVEVLRGASLEVRPGELVGLVGENGSVAAGRVRRVRGLREEPGINARVVTATRLGFHEQARRPLLLVLLVVVPFFFITRAIARTKPTPRRIGLPGGGEVLTTMKDVHGASRVGILQNPMFGDGTPGGLAYVFPDYGAGRVVIDGAFSAGFHAGAELALALGWLAALGLAVSWALRRLLRGASCVLRTTTDLRRQKRPESKSGPTFDAGC